MILIRKVKDNFGWLGNMSPYPVNHNGKTYLTSEALFQTLRFDDEEIIEEIRNQKSPMSAKMKAKKHRSKHVVVPMSETDLDNMRMVLRLKMLQHPDIRRELILTVTDEIIEDCSRRPTKSGLFWGAKFSEESGKKKKKNWLGRLWMKLREELNPPSMDRLVIRTSSNIRFPFPVETLI